jgi:hypothetical protein
MTIQHILFGQSLQLTKGPFKNNRTSPRFISDSSTDVRLMKKMAAERGPQIGQAGKNPGKKRLPLRSRLWAWTGFADKTLWEWLQLLGALAMLVALAIAGFWFTTSQEERQKKLETLRAKSQAALSFANLSETDLSGAGGVTKEMLDQQAKSLRSTTMPDGTIYPGRYATREFEPALSFGLSDSWGRGQFDPSESPDFLFIRGPEEVDLLLTNPLHVFDPSYPSEAKVFPAPENAEEWVSWFQRHPNLDTSMPVPASVGEVPGKQIDVTVTSTPENYPKEICGEQPCVPLYTLSDENRVLVYEGFKDRFVIVDVGAETVLIDVFAPADRFDEFLPKAQKVLDSVEWKGE